MEKLRKTIGSFINTGNLEDLLNKTAELHGHYCPGIALGVIAGQKAMSIIQGSSDGMEDLLAITETNNCFSDGIQMVTGCTFGNNSLIFRDYGKMAFSLTKRDGKGVRINIKSEAKEYMHKKYPDFSEDYNTVVKDQDHSPEALKKFKLSGYEKAFIVIKIEFNELFNITNQKIIIPDYAPSHESIVCDRCDEIVMISRIRKLKKENFCIPCSNSEFYQLDGNGIYYNEY